MRPHCTHFRCRCSRQRFVRIVPQLRTKPVSYTHLDVYKRQAHDIAADFLEKMRSIGYTPEKAAALLEHWDTEEVEPHE